MCLRTTYKRSYIRILEQSNLQWVWIGTAVPISYTVIPGKIASVHVRTCSTPRQTPTLSFVNSSLVRSRSLPANLAAASRESYTLWIFSTFAMFPSFQTVALGPYVKT